MNKDRTIFVTVYAEELYHHPVHGGWDATIKVEVELMAADPSVGCPGGTVVIGHEYLKFDRLSQAGFVVVSLEEGQLESIDPTICEMIKCLGDHWVKANEDMICDLAREQADKSDEAAREANEDMRLEEMMLRSRHGY